MQEDRGESARLVDEREVLRRQHWTRLLVEGHRHAIDGMLLEARARHGTWFRVADELGGVLEAIGAQWACGALTIAEEHLASDALARALARIDDALPTPTVGPRCVLACAAGDEHTLGLSLAELTLREVGWAPLWLGRSPPIGELAAFIDSVAMVALSASASSTNREQLETIVRTLGAICLRRRIPLVLGGSGAWPDPSEFGGVRLTSFTAFHEYLAAR